MEQIKCKICGKEFTPIQRLSGGYQKTCSPECCKENARRITREYATNPYVKKIRRKKYLERTKNKTVCKICGKPTTVPSGGRYKPQYHLDCLLSEAIKMIEDGKPFTPAQYGRLKTRGYPVRWIKRFMNSHDIEDEDIIEQMKNERKENYDD